ncbi:hypothetical protein BST97_08985 [Nonlabens spongiae]|uniref:N-acetyltransferase domain-containing protein n=2 Tax=Nonlabens spongiae TaxID=331648 RepID=A0A1W6MKL5_9FLAO|nr:hypothetical protein BST97_08985 [Nonlabens spongiae]
MSIIIKEILAEQTREIRQTVLRQGLPAATTIFKGDELETTFHLGAFEKNKLVGIATYLFKNKSAIQELFSDEKFMYQLRGMAVMENEQGKGIGKKLVEFAECRLKEDQIDVLWFHARTSAVPFYEKQGYQTVGEELDLEPAGPHFKMYKEL